MRYLFLGGPRDGEWVDVHPRHRGEGLPTVSVPALWGPALFVNDPDGLTHSSTLITYHPHRVMLTGWRVWLWMYLVEGLTPRRLNEDEGRILPGGVIGPLSSELGSWDINMRNGWGRQ